eukprot:1150022-Pelagomonas_calceolata.AAC.3
MPSIVLFFSVTPTQDTSSPAGRNLIIRSLLKSLTAYPHLCHKLGTSPKDELTFENPQSWPSQEVALPKHTWDIQIVAVWNTAGRVRLNNHNPTWIPGLASNIPKAKWLVDNLSNDPIRTARHAIMPGISKNKKLPLDKKQIAKVPHKPATDITAPITCQSNPNLQLKVANWKSWAYTARLRTARNVVKPNGTGITNTIGRAALAAIGAARTHEYTHIATDNLSSLHQLKKQILYPQKHRYHAQEHFLKTI